MAKKQRARLPNENPNDTSKVLGFRTGSQVKLSRRFFDNHGVDYVNIGIGVVVSKSLPSKESLPHLIVRFPFQVHFFMNETLKTLMLHSSQQTGVKERQVLLSIYPAYLEKVK